MSGKAKMSERPSWQHPSRSRRDPVPKASREHVDLDGVREDLLPHPCL